jgi:hypothetical protein
MPYTRFFVLFRMFTTKPTTKRSKQTNDITSHCQELPAVFRGKGRKVSFAMPVWVSSLLAAVCGLYMGFQYLMCAKSKLSQAECLFAFALSGGLENTPIFGRFLFVLVPRRKWHFPLSKSTSHHQHTNLFF